MNKKKPNVHVMYRKEEKVWATQSEKADRAAGLFLSQAEAIERAKEIAKNRGVETVIHKKVGNEIRDKDSYGNDPNPPKDKVN